MAVDGKTIKAVFMAAMDKTAPAERAAYLDEACAGDSELRKCVEALLVAHGQPDPLLDQPAAQHVAAGKSDIALDFLAPSTKPGSLGHLGHYEVIEAVGHGGMGTVLRAFDEKLQRVVAVKVLAPELAANAPARQRFVREARAAAAVSHDNVIAIHAVEKDGPIPYLIMQFVQGCTLQAKVDRTGPLPLKEILRLGMQIADGLAAAHRQGLIHRDVKPANILLENGIERVKITDFGLARTVDDPSLTESGYIAGTPAYMSPEQANGEHVDYRSDLFSLGSVLYTLCAGHPPFRDESTLAVLKRVCEDTPRPLRAVNPDIPEWLDATIAKLQAKNPAQRFGSAAEVATLLSRRLAQLQSDGALGDSEATHALRPRSQRPATKRSINAPMLVGAAFVLIGAAIAGWFIYQAWSAGRPAENAGVAPALPGPVAATIPPQPVVLQPTKPLLKHGNWIRSLAFSPDGKVLASGSLDWTIILWNTSNWTPRVRIPGHGCEVFGLAFSADSSKLATTRIAKDDCAIRLYDVDSGAPAGTVGEPWAGLFAVAWMPNGKTLVTTGTDNQLNFWDIATGQREAIDNVCSKHVRGLSISPNGKLIATGGTGPSRLWDLETRKEIPSHLPPDLCPIFLPPDGAELAGNDHNNGTFSVCNLASGKVRTRQAHPREIQGLAVSPDGRFLASVGSEGIGYVWSVADSAPVATLRGHRGMVGAVAFAPDGKQLATGGLEDHLVCIWDLPQVCWVRK